MLFRAERFSTDFVDPGQRSDLREASKKERLQKPGFTTGIDLFSQVVLTSCLPAKQGPLSVCCVCRLLKPIGLLAWICQSSLQLVRHTVWQACLEDLHQALHLCCEGHFGCPDKPLHWCTSAVWELLGARPGFITGQCTRKVSPSSAWADARHSLLLQLHCLLHMFSLIRCASWV